MRGKKKSHKNNILHSLSFPLGILAAFLIFLAALNVPPARAVEAGAGGQATLEGLIAYAAEHNPRLRAARLEWQRAMQMHPQASSLDDPMLMYTYPVEPIVTRLGPQEHIVSLSQKFPFPGKLGVKGEIADRGAEIARLRYEKALRDVAFEVKKAWYELFYFDKAVRLTSEQIGVLDFYIKAEMADYAVGRKDLNDVVDAQTRYARATNDLAVLEELKRAEETRLNTLLNLPPEEPAAVPQEPEAKKLDWTLDDLYSFVLDNEEVEIAGKNVERGALEERLAGYKYLPDFQLGVNYSAIGKPEMSVRDGGQDAASVTFGINIPIWFGRNRAAGEEARLGRERAVQEKASVKNDIRNRLKKLYTDAVSNNRLMDIYSGSLIPQAKELIETAEIKYRNGEGSIAGIFNAQTMWLNFNLAYYRAFSSYLERTAEIESLAGRHLEMAGGAE